VNLDKIKKNILTIFHSFYYYVGTWYYEMGTGDFGYTIEKEGCPELSLKEWVWGKLVNYEGEIICIICLSPLASKLNVDTLLDIKYSCEYVSKKTIDYMLSSSGEVLIESKKCISN